MIQTLRSKNTEMGVASSDQNQQVVKGRNLFAIFRIILLLLLIGAMSFWAANCKGKVIEEEHYALILVVRPN